LEDLLGLRPELPWESRLRALGAKEFRDGREGTILQPADVQLVGRISIVSTRVAAPVRRGLSRVHLLGATYLGQPSSPRRAGITRPHPRILIVSAGGRMVSSYKPPPSRGSLRDLERGSVISASLVVRAA